ncbi:methyltransferase domain-containing protein [Methylocapsa sp. S129]|uniref:methyltransferase domain-containing protein n=1 Tax=Methylocapsa sp. S129 TaxID=1641869 RepID=UPI00131A9F1E|nr:methyltransferase domain-containing protein [Methylocapsa sp. S129]
MSDAELSTIPSGRPASRRWSIDDPRSLVAENSLQLREIGASFLHGAGVEFGAASNPLPIPADCVVTYGDTLTYEELLARLYPGQSAADMIKPTILASIEDLGAVPSNLDFMASAHVIEHVPDPVGAIVRAASKLRPGGHLLLMVPDMKETFDRHRALTTLDHLLLDFYAPSRERDKAHFQEFYRDAFTTPEDQYEETWIKNWEERFPIHYHTWTYESFKNMVDTIVNSLSVYTEYWSHPTRGNEFCFVLKK